jgi:hypothetical protein
MQQKIQEICKTNIQEYRYFLHKLTYDTKANMRYEIHLKKG